jgi:hypothetical protein
MPNWPDFQAIPELFGQGSSENGFPAQPLQRKPAFSNFLRAVPGREKRRSVRRQYQAAGCGEWESAY